MDAAEPDDGRPAPAAPPLVTSDLGILLRRNLPPAGPLPPHIDESVLATEILLVTPLRQFSLPPYTRVAGNDSRRRSEEPNPQRVHRVGVEGEPARCDGGEVGFACAR